MPFFKLLTVLLIGTWASLPQPANATCDRGDRISHGNAACLDASWINPEGLDILSEEPWYRVRNLCSERGKVVAKVDVTGATDRTLYLNTPHERVGRTIGRIRGIYCCADLSDLCSP